jgi:hypothetical protein
MVGVGLAVALLAVALVAVALQTANAGNTTIKQDNGTRSGRLI